MKYEQDLEVDPLNISQNDSLSSRNSLRELSLLLVMKLLYEEVLSGVADPEKEKFHCRCWNSLTFCGAWLQRFPAQTILLSCQGDVCKVFSHT